MPRRFPRPVGHTKTVLKRFAGVRAFNHKDWASTWRKCTERVRSGCRELSEVAGEDAFEVDTILSAIGFAGIVQDALSIGEMCEGGEADPPRGGKQIGLLADTVESDQTAEYDALVISPSSLAILVTGVVEAVIDQVVGVHHARVGEPIPFPGSPVEVAHALLAMCAQGKTGRARKEIPRVLYVSP